LGIRQSLADAKGDPEGEVECFAQLRRALVPPPVPTWVFPSSHDPANAIRP